VILEETECIKGQFNKPSRARHKLLYLGLSVVTHSTAIFHAFEVGFFWSPVRVEHAFVARPLEQRMLSTAIQPNPQILMV
jgi:hypothetical protein